MSRGMGGAAAARWPYFVCLYACAHCRCPCRWLRYSSLPACRNASTCLCLPLPAAAQPFQLWVRLLLGLLAGSAGLPARYAVVGGGGCTLTVGHKGFLLSQQRVPSIRCPPPASPLGCRLPAALLLHACPAPQGSAQRPRQQQQQAEAPVAAKTAAKRNSSGDVADLLVSSLLSDCIALWIVLNFDSTAHCEAPLSDGPQLGAPA